MNRRILQLCLSLVALLIFGASVLAPVASAQFVSFTLAAQQHGGGTPAPTFVQAVQMPSDIQAQNGIGASVSTGNLVRKCFPNSTKIGNTIFAHIRTSEATIGDIAVSDDGSNTYTLRVDEIAGARTNAVFTAPVTTASRCVTVTYNDAVGEHCARICSCGSERDDDTEVYRARVSVSGRARKCSVPPSH
jgi:hypothetical protein